MLETTIEVFSRGDHSTSQIVTTFTVSNRNDERETQREKHLRLHVDTASDSDVSGIAVSNCILVSFDSCVAVVRLV